MKFYGAPYPIVKHPLGFFRTQTDLNQIKSDLLVLLLTNPGERVMLPDFGVPLRSLIFEPNDPILAERAREMISLAISMWEPRVNINNIDIRTGIDQSELNMDEIEDTEHILHISISFSDFEDIQNIQELKLEIPLSGV